MGGLLKYNDQNMIGHWTFENGMKVKGVFEAENAVGSFNQNGDSYFVDPTSGDDGMTGKTPGTAKATLAAGEELLSANQNDKLYYLCGSSSISLTETLTWDKNYTHLIGVCAPTNVAQRARVFMTAATADTPMWDISASGCSFNNVYFFHGINDAAALVCTAVSGGRNSFNNVHFAGIGHATQGDQAGAISLSLAGAEENHFQRCTIGVDTVARSTTNTEISCSAQAVRNTFEDCLILSFCDNAGHNFVKAGSGGLDRWINFKRCNFFNAVESTSTTMTEAMDIHDSAGGFVHLDECNIVGATDVAAADNGNVLVNGVRAAATSALALAVTQ